VKSEYKNIKVGYSRDKGVVVAFDGRNFIAFFRRKGLKNDKRKRN